MKLTENAKAYLNRLFPDCGDTFAETDPEFAELFGNFAFDEVVSSDDLSEKTRFLAILAALIGCQGVDAFRAMLPAALNFGVTPSRQRRPSTRLPPIWGSAGCTRSCGRRTKSSRRAA